MPANVSSIDQYAVIGNPIAHSKSPYLHASFAKQCQQALSYRALLAPLDGFESTVRQFIHQGGRGANVTLPFKLAAFHLCDEVTPRAQAAQAVNTLSFEHEKIYGDNTDGYGLVTDIVNNAGIPLQHTRILLLGAGGAARGVILPLLVCQPGELVIANRSLEKARQLVEQFNSFDTVSCVDFEKICGQFDVIINATSASITAQLLPIPDTLFEASSLAYDMMYSDQPTLFLQQAAKCGAQTRDGWGMLVEQAAEAFSIWRGIRPDTSPLLLRGLRSDDQIYVALRARCSTVIFPAGHPDSSLFFCADMLVDKPQSGLYFFHAQSARPYPEKKTQCALAAAMGFVRSYF